MNVLQYQPESRLGRPFTMISAIKKSIQYIDICFMRIMLEIKTIFMLQKCLYSSKKMSILLDYLFLKVFFETNLQNLFNDWPR